MELGNKKSKPRRVKQGFPQGGVICPKLFKFYLYGISPPPNAIEIVTFADECTIMELDSGVDDVCVRLNTYLAELSAFFHARNMKKYATKSMVTLFIT